MTAEPDLPINDAVPAPTKIEPGNQFLWNWRQMQVYAQACVAHATAAKDAEVEALRAEVDRLQEIVRPKREKECLTLDHWRTRAYYLEENWSRCSRACAVEQTKRERAEARANKLAEALRHQRWCRTCAEDGWESCEDGRKADALLNPAAAQENDDA